MGEKSNIEWTNDTWNPWHGCKKVTEGCKFCYMYREKDRYNQDGAEVKRSTPSTFNKPMSFEGPLVFTCSWSDFFIDAADEWRSDAWKIIENTPWLTYQILTKRPERIMDNLPGGWGRGWENVWLGVSIENEKNMYRLRYLNGVRAKVKFVSFEPLLGPIDVLSHEWMKGIDWVVIGGESGNDDGPWGYRDCEMGWIRKLVFDCQSLGIKVFVKQLGTGLAKSIGASRHGKVMEEWPEVIRVREIPEH